MTATASPLPAPKAPEKAALATSPELGEAIARTPARMVPRDQVHESPFNRRRTWGDLDELAASFKSVGILEDLLGRPHPKKPGHVELVFGHRRLRAAEIAKLPELPIKVRDFIDDQVVEIQAIENLQRTDIHKIEEAETFELLRQKKGLTAEQLAKRVGVSKAYIYASLKYLDLVPEARQAFADNKITAAVALFIARMKAPVQPAILKEMVRKDYNGEVPSTREAFRIIKDRFMLTLVEAPWDLADATLVPKAGSCRDCTKRTGNQRELFGDIKGGDVCTDVDCFEEKKEARAKRVLADAKAAGLTVLEGEAAEKATGYNSAFIALEERVQLPYDARKRQPTGPANAATEEGDEDLEDDDDDEGYGPTFREIAKNAALEVTVARGKDGKVVELVKKAALVPVVKKAGYKPGYQLETPRSSGGGGGQSHSQEIKAQREKAMAKRVATFAVASAVVEAATRIERTDLPFWRLLADALLDHVDHDPCGEILKRRVGPDGMPKKKPGYHLVDYRGALHKLLHAMTSVDSVRALVVELAISAKGTYSFSTYGGSALGPHLVRMAEHYKLDPVKIGSIARATHQVEKKGGAKKPVASSEPLRPAKKAKGSVPAKGIAAAAKAARKAATKKGRKK